MAFGLKDRSLVAATLLFLGGCAAIQPDVMYEGAHPLGDTAVFSVYDERSSVCTVATVQNVGDKQTSHWAYPLWVRVKPGTHSFLLHCTTDIALRYPSVQFQRAELLVTVENMRPRHVYVTRFSRGGNRIAVKVEDLGEDPEYTIPQTGNRKLRASF